MKTLSKAKAMAIYVGEFDNWHGLPLYVALIQKAREMGMGGATATRGIMGFGANSSIHSTAILKLSEDLPVIVQVYESPERIQAFLAAIGDMVSEGLVVSWDVDIEVHKHHPAPAKA